MHCVKPLSPPGASGALAELTLAPADQILEADVARREALQSFRGPGRATQKEVSKSVGRASAEERPAILHAQRNLPMR